MAKSKPEALKKILTEGIKKMVSSIKFQQHLQLEMLMVVTFDNKEAIVCNINEKFTPGNAAQKHQMEKRPSRVNLNRKQEPQTNTVSAPGLAGNVLLKDNAQTTRTPAILTEQSQTLDNGSQAEDTQTPTGVNQSEDKSADDNDVNIPASDPPLVPGSIRTVSQARPVLQGGPTPVAHEAFPILIHRVRVHTISGVSKPSTKPVTRASTITNMDEMEVEVQDKGADDNKGPEMMNEVSEVMQVKKEVEEYDEYDDIDGLDSSDCTSSWFDPTTYGSLTSMATQLLDQELPDIEPESKLEEHSSSSVDDSFADVMDSEDPAEVSSNENSDLHPRPIPPLKGPPYHCRYCKKEYKKRRLVIMHERKHTGERPFECHICGKNYPVKDSLSTHLKTHSGIKPYSCSLCDKTFVTKGNLQAHVRVHSDERPYKCQECGRCFRRQWGLKSHLRTHTREKTLKCSLCDETFARPEALQKHELIHQGIKQFLCPQCGKQFWANRDLTVHMKTHLGEKPFQCPQCFEKFTKVSSLKRHVEAHTGAKNFMCEICGKAFTRAHQVTIHMKSHFGEDPYHCQFCNLGFKSRSMLNKHVSQHHPDQGYLENEMDSQRQMF